MKAHLRDEPTGTVNAFLPHAVTKLFLCLAAAIIDRDDKPKCSAQRYRDVLRDGRLWRTSPASSWRYRLPRELGPCRSRPIRARIHAHQARCSRSWTNNQPPKNDYAPSVCAGHFRASGSPWHWKMSGDRIEHGWEHPAAHGNARTGANWSDGCRERNDVFSGAGSDDYATDSGRWRANAGSVGNDAQKSQARGRTNHSLVGLDAGDEG